MTKDPYKVLGVSQDATDDEIKKAYRALTKKYHPDLHPDDPTAAEKMNEINTAYDSIKNAAARSAYASQSAGPDYGSNPYSSYGPFGGYAYTAGGQTNGWGYHSQSSSYQQERSEYQAARNYIRNGMYKEALNALSGVAVSDRDGRWYYLTAVANMYQGNKVAALDAIRRAVSIEPDNEEYQSLLEQLQSGRDFYNNYTKVYRGGLSADKVCLGVLCANALMGPMCGWRFICC